MTSQRTNEEVAARILELERTPSLSGAGARIPAARFAADLAVSLAVTCGLHALLHAVGAIGTPRFDVAFALSAAVCGVLLVLGAYRALKGPCHVEAVTAVIKAVLVTAPFLGSPLLALAADVPALVLALVALRVFLGPVEERLALGRLAPVLVYGAGNTGRLLAQRLLHETSLGLHPVGFVDDDPALAGKEVRVGEGERGVRLPVIGTGASLDAAVEGTHAAAVFIAIPSLGSEKIAAIAARLEPRRIPVAFVPSSGDRAFASLQVRVVGGVPLLTTRLPLRRAVYTAFKRAFDLTLALLLLVLAAPFLIVAIVLVRATSPGPALFKHVRIGQDGRPFTILKLRTMYADSDAYAFHPDRKDDRRVTPIGRWLRRLSLDELPQLYNIVRGEMSFVGPRPEMPFIVASYDDTQLQRLMVKPGLTGLWQVSPDRAFRIHDNVQYDLYYVENRSFALDLAILILTPFLLVSQRAAK